MEPFAAFPDSSVRYIDAYGALIEHPTAVAEYVELMASTVHSDVRFVSVAFDRYFDSMPPSGNIEFAVATMHAWDPHIQVLHRRGTYPDLESLRFSIGNVLTDACSGFTGRVVVTGWDIASLIRFLGGEGRFGWELPSHACVLDAKLIASRCCAHLDEVSNLEYLFRYFGEHGGAGYTDDVSHLSSLQHSANMAVICFVQFHRLLGPSQTGFVFSPKLMRGLAPVSKAS